ncbi:MAG: sulfurtransferase [Pseudomonadales bacterium]|nr:sulfurtransferase [Pseudomonadales bacterium]
MNLVIFASFFFRLFGVDWESIDQRIAEEFPEVESVSTQQLHSQYQAEFQSLPIIIDVRAAEEFAVSHLNQALNIETGAGVAAQFSDKSAPIIVYCSVGYRSAGVAAELESLGYSNVKNLQHSIFEWANRDLPMENAAGDTDLVHPFNRIWGTLVEPDLHSFQPE